MIPSKIFPFIESAKTIIIKHWASIDQVKKTVIKLSESQDMEFYLAALRGWRFKIKTIVINYVLFK
jgi:hypothetical protein